MSLRGRLLVGLGVVAAVLVLAAVVITRTTETYLIDRIDAQLSAASPNLRDLGGGGPPGTDGRPGGPARTGQIWVGIVEDDGSVTTVQAGILDTDDRLPQISADRAIEVATDPKPHNFTVSTSSGDDVRVAVTRPFGGANTVLLGLPLNDVSDAVRRLVTVEVVATSVILALLGLVAFWVIRLGVRPIKQMTATATAIAEGELSHRVPEVAPGTEAGELGVALNAMLARIEDAFGERDATEARLRRFAADASHELRTPVTTVRGYAELYRRGGLQEPGELANAMHRTEQEAIRMGTLIEDLLLLARLDQGRPLEQGEVDLGVLAVDAVSDAKAAHPERPITAVVADGVTALGDEGRLRQVVANLVSNALVHTDAHVPVVVRALRSDGRAVLEVTDAGPGLDAEAATQAFERFYRADKSSIVQAIVEAHGGEVSLMTAPGEGLTVRVSLP